MSELEKLVFEKLYQKGFYFIPTDTNKAPAIIQGVQMGVTHAHRDKTAIIQYLESGCGIAIVGGSIEGNNKYLVTLDLDVKRENGIEALQKLQQDYGVLPETLVFQTPSGGRHLLFLSEEQIGSCNNAFKIKHGQPGIDVKGYHGYTCCPPTQSYSILEDRELATLPKEWIIFLKATITDRNRPVEDESGISKMSVPPHVDLVTTYNKKISIFQALEVAGYKKINNKTYCHPFGSTTPANVTILRNTNLYLHGAEFVSYHFGAHDRVQRGPHDAFDILRILSYQGNWDLTANAVKINYPEIAQEANNSDEDYERRGGHLTQIRHYQQTHRKNQEFIHKCLREKDVCFVTGASENYKTFWCLAMALSGATEVPFLGVHPVRPFKSTMVLTESEDDFLDRVDAWIKHYSQLLNLDPKKLEEQINENVVAYFNNLVLDDPESVQDFAKFKSKMVAASFRTNVYFLDHFSNNYRGDENDNNAVSQWLEVLRLKVRHENCAIVVVHHPSKGGEMMRGASVLHNNNKVVYEFERLIARHGDEPRKPVTVIQKKCNYFNGFESYELTSHVYELYHDDSTVIPTIRSGLTISTKPKKLNIPYEPKEPDETHGCENNDNTIKEKVKDTKQLVLDILREYNKLSPEERQIDSKTIEMECKLSQGKVSKILNTLEEERLIRRIELKGTKKLLWQAIDIENNS